MSGPFLNQKAMSEYKYREAVRNSQVKRGEYKRSNHTGIAVCGCDFGQEDAGSCHFEYDNTKYYNDKDVAARANWRTPDESRSDQ